MGTATELDTKSQKPKQVSFYRADTNMAGCFGPSGSGTFARLSAKAPKTGKNGKILLSFNPERFQYTGWQSIFSDNKLNPAGTGEFALSPERENSLKAMKEWKALSSTPENELTQDQRTLIHYVNLGQVPSGANAEQTVQLRSWMQAKADWTGLQNERATVTSALTAIKESNPTPAKKRGGAKTGVLSPTATVAQPAFNGTSFAVPRM